MVDYNHSCLACQYIVLDFDGGYSEWTPGSGLVFYCMQGYFNIGNDIESNTLRDLHIKGQTCPDFEKQEI